MGICDLGHRKMSLVHLGKLHIRYELLVGTNETVCDVQVLVLKWVSAARAGFHCI